jgi:hypothetical protein
VTVCTDRFLPFAIEKATAMNAVGLPLVTIPHPLTGRRAEEMTRIAAETVPQVLAALTSAPVWPERP